MDDEQRKRCERIARHMEYEALLWQDSLDVAADAAAIRAALAENAAQAAELKVWREKYGIPTRAYCQACRREIVTESGQVCRECGGQV